MSDDTLKDLVLKHDNEIALLANSIENQSKSIESLVQSNAETNKRLEEISGYLSKQALFDNKLETMGKELSETFKRAFGHIEHIKSIQESSIGCSSVQLLKKDVQLNTDTNKMLTEQLKVVTKQVDSLPSSKAVQWGLGLVIVYLISFGSYVITALHTNEVAIAKIMDHISK